MFIINSATLLLCLSLYVLQTNSGVVSFIDPCRWNDAECILKSTKKAVPFLAPGLPELGVPSLDPMELQDVNGDNGELKLKVKELKVIGLSKCDIIKSGRPEKMKYMLTMECPILATGIYKVNGKLYLLDIYGEGDFEIKTEKVLIEAFVKLVSFKGKDGKEYYKFSNLDYKYKPLKKVYFKLTNLYNGDAAKAEPVLKILDESWKEITEEMGKPVIQEVIVRAMHSIGGFVKQIPASEIELQ